ncbi:hypothetical protein EGI26_01545 [Lacihabitans sp. CCS-44]|uniref:hypothetical protein n=1 Tax=Lacihabitans sp. CCS-44 TaxID=2487331 RepID=UPI0020CE381E|nr:hypothetical protein [Lacihabitans sp. CCS-44]MCP9753845.1 hypothetical protein [Lacihabitans sp. CCS-44]
MKKILILGIIGSFVFNTSFGQKEKLFKYPFVNQTEFGVLFGRVKNTNYYYPGYSSYWPSPTQNGFSIQNVASLSLQTFNGFQVRKKTTVGLTTGLDLYSSSLLVPVALGVRHVFYEKNQQGAKLQAGLDAGVGSAIANAANSFETVKGGVLLNPTVGFKFPTKNGSSWLINFGYKYQYMEISQIIQPTDIYNISSTETRNLKRFQVKLGFEF